MLIQLFSCQVMSDSLWLQGLHYARLPCPLPSPRICPSSCPLNWWCQSTISSSVSLFFSLPSIFPSIRVFSSESAIHIRWPKYWSFSFSISPPEESSGLISLRLTGLISLLSKGLSRVFYSTTVREHKFFSTLPLLSVQLLHSYMTIGKSIALTVQTSVGMWCFCFYHTV